MTYLVLVMKKDRKCFTGSMLDRLEEFITDLC